MSDFGSGISGVVDASDTYVSLTTFQNQIWLGWSGIGNKQLNVMPGTFNAQSVLSFDESRKTTLNSTSPSAPAIAAFNNRLCIAWRGDGNDQLNIASSSDGKLFNEKHTISDLSDSGPTLAVFNNKLWMGWTGKDNQQLNVMATSDGQNFDGSTKQVMGDTSDIAPSLCAYEGKLWMGWQGRGNKFLNFMAATQGNNFDSGSKIIFQGKTVGAPAMSLHSDGKLYALLISEKEDSYSTYEGMFLVHVGQGSSYDANSTRQTNDYSDIYQGRPALASYNGKLITALSTPQTGSRNVKGHSAQIYYFEVNAF